MPVATPPVPDAPAPPGPDDASVLARKGWRTMEPYHGMIYFSPLASAAYAGLGITGRAGYFASRAAAMGAVPADVVIATFFNFRPELVRAAIPKAWSIASPDAILAARYDAADAQLRALLDDDVITSPEMEEAAALARIAAEACTPEGRPLFAGHAAQPWPDEPHLQLFHAITLLREHRGDGHIAALVLAGLSGCEALVTHGAATEGAVPAAILQASRGWTDPEWAAAVDRLRERGWLGDDGTFTATGDAARRGIESATDEAARQPYEVLGAERAARLRELVRPWSRAIVASGVFLSAPAS